MARPLITVKTLTAAARRDGVVTLPEDALITPAARDWLRGTNVPVRSVASAAPEVEKGPTIYLVGDAACPWVRALIPGLEGRPNKFRFIDAGQSRTTRLAALGTVCAALAECGQRRAIVLSAQPALVTLVANHGPRIRAAEVRRPSEMFDLVRTCGVNLLVLDPEAVALRQMQALIDGFLSDRTAVADDVAAVLEHLAEA